MARISPFRIEVDPAVLVDLRERLERTRWPEPEPVDDWSQGVPLSYLRDLCRHWQGGYDWPVREARLNALAQFRTEIDGLGIHFLHVRSPESGALPLLITHGWPGSIVEFLEVIPALSDPARHGGDAADAFHIVCPSLPGYGFSDKPASTGWGVERTAWAWAELMRRLGYRAYCAQGGDWGAVVSSTLATIDPDHVLAIHLNLVHARPPRGLTHPTPAEQAAIDAIQHYEQAESGYSKLQSTRPQTIGYSLLDSPAGLCAWILEKFWSCDLRARGGRRVPGVAAGRGLAEHRQPQGGVVA